jgi:outer membrane protein assembly factor BamE
MRPHRLIVCSLAWLALLAGCESMYSVNSSVKGGLASAASWAPVFLKPYRPDVHQGNIVTKEMVDQLRIGMSREQVRFMLGTPLMTSEFRKDRADYIYYLNPLKGPVQNRRLTVYFKDNRLERFNSDPMPADEEADALILGTNVKRVRRNPPQPPPAIPMPDVSTPGPGTQSTPGSQSPN